MCACIWFVSILEFRWFCCVSYLISSRWIRGNKWLFHCYRRAQLHVTGIEWTFSVTIKIQFISFACLTHSTKPQKMAELDVIRNCYPSHIRKNVSSNIRSPIPDTAPSLCSFFLLLLFGEMCSFRIQIWNMCLCVIISWHICLVICKFLGIRFMLKQIMRRQLRKPPPKSCNISLHDSEFHFSRSKRNANVLFCHSRYKKENKMFVY